MRELLGSAVIKASQIAYFSSGRQFVYKIVKTPSYFIVGETLGVPNSPVEVVVATKLFVGK
jgi:hypothetical protein